MPKRAPAFATALRQETGEIDSKSRQTEEVYARTENDDTRRKPLLSEVKQELGADDGNRTRVLSLGS